MSEMDAATEELDVDDGFMSRVLKLEELDTDLYMTPKSWKFIAARGTYGGQIVAQALMAASKTVPPGLYLHSMHSYFLRAGDPTLPTIYRVLRTRDGQSFSSRTVSAVQKGKPILTLQASFHNEAAEAPSVLQFQPVMPIVAHHQNLSTTREIVDKIVKRDDLSQKAKTFVSRSTATNLSLDFKPVEPDVFFKQARSDQNTIFCWIRVTGKLGNCYK